MSYKLTLPSKLSLALGAAILGIIPAWSQAGLSQTFDVPNAPETEVTPSNESSGSDLLRGGLDPISIIHNANLSRSRNAGEFADDTRRSLQQAADEFKLLQQQRFQQQNNAPASPSSDPISGSNTP